MQLDRTMSARYLLHTHHIKSVGRHVYHRSAGDPDLRLDAERIFSRNRYSAVVQKNRMPKRLSRFSRSVKRIDAVVLCRYEDDFVRPACNAQMWHVQRLRVHFAIHRERSQLAELGGVHIPRGEHGLIAIQSGAREIVVVREYGNRPRSVARVRRWRVVMS